MGPLNLNAKLLWQYQLNEFTTVSPECEIEAA
jgi:hypothetical protein